jgi:hypothetical protein
MHRTVLALAVVLVIAVHPRSAHAIKACDNNEGFAPAAHVGTELPPHARIVFFTERFRGKPIAVTATLAGKAIKPKVTDLVSGSAVRVLLIEIPSARTGILEVTVAAMFTAQYVVTKKAAAMPKAIEVETGRSTTNIEHSVSRERYDGLALRLPVGTPVIKAHVRMRRDAKGVWNELELPVYDHDFGEAGPLLRIGELGCVSNYSVPLLEAGVDIEVTLMLVDGTTRIAKDLPAHVVLAPPPPQPKPKNQP